MRYTVWYVCYYNSESAETGKKIIPQKKNLKHSVKFEKEKIFNLKLSLKRVFQLHIK